MFGRRSVYRKDVYNRTGIKTINCLQCKTEIAFTFMVRVVRKLLREEFPSLFLYQNKKQAYFYCKRILEKFRTGERRYAD